MKKVMSVLVIALMVMTVFLVSCAVEEVDDADLENQVAEMTNEELEAVIEEPEGSDALAGQAVRSIQRRKLVASKMLIKKLQAETKLGDLFKDGSIEKVITNGKVSALIKIDLPGVDKSISNAELTESVSNMLDGLKGGFGKGSMGNWCCEGPAGEEPVCGEC